MKVCRCPGSPRRIKGCFMRCRRQAPTGRPANPTLAGGSDDEAADTIRCGQEPSRSGGPSKGRAMTENSNSNDDNGAGQIATTDDLFGLPGDGVHWTGQRCDRYEYRKVLMYSTNPDDLVPSTT